MDKKSAKKAAFLKVDYILTSYCDGCFLHKQLVEDLGRTHAHRFCISECTVGDQLKKIGNGLNNKE